MLNVTLINPNMQNEADIGMPQCASPWLILAKFKLFYRVSSNSSHTFIIYCLQTCLSTHFHYELADTQMWWQWDAEYTSSGSCSGLTRTASSACSECWWLTIGIYQKRPQSGRQQARQQLMWYNNGILPSSRLTADLHDSQTWIDQPNVTCSTCLGIKIYLI
jgi:hypothetical protein